MESLPGSRKVARIRMTICVNNGRMEKRTTIALHPAATFG
jgi:hypothetical protein